MATSWSSILIPQLRGRRWEWCGRGYWISVSESHLAGVDTTPDVFHQPTAASVTFTGIHRAKGNEAAMVYIINAENCQSAVSDLARIRNRLFTAITRSKAWVRVLGVGRRMKELTREYEALKARQFKLSFRYPSARGTHATAHHPSRHDAGGAYAPEKQKSYPQRPDSRLRTRRCSCGRPR